MVDAYRKRTRHGLKEKEEEDGGVWFKQKCLGVLEERMEPQIFVAWIDKCVWGVKDGGEERERERERKSEPLACIHQGP